MSKRPIPLKLHKSFVGTRGAVNLDSGALRGGPFLLVIKRILFLTSLCLGLGVAWASVPSENVSLDRSIESKQVSQKKGGTEKSLSLKNNLPSESAPLASTSQMDSAATKNQTANPSLTSESSPLSNKSSVLDNAEVTILGFETWKNQQIIKVQNRVVRLANQILLIKTDRLKERTYQTGDHIVAPEIDNKSLYLPLEDLSRDLKQAQQDLQIAQELGFEDYLSVYLSQLGENPVQLKLLAEKLSTEQVTKALLYLQRYKLGGRTQAKK